MCNGKQIQTEEKDEFQELRKEQQRAKCSNWKEIPEVRQKQKKEENRKRAPALLRNADYDNESKKSVSSLAESVESGEISFSTSEWKTG